MNALAWILRLGLAGVFVYAGALKILDPAAFALDIRAYRMVSSGTANLIAMYLPWLEVIVGLGVLLPWTTRGAALLQAALMLVFLLVLGSAWWRGIDVACGCFGGDGAESDYRTAILRNGAILAGAAFVGWQTRIHVEPI